jgi:hypothetical protein
MKENVFGPQLVDKVRHEMGGEVIKIADRSTFGLPDYMHVNDDIVTFIETKIGEPKFVQTFANGIACAPWSVVNDLRQYEVCRRLARCAIVLYVIYWPHVRMSAVIDVDLFEQYRYEKSQPPIWLEKREEYCGLAVFDYGHGDATVVDIMKRRRKVIYENLKYEL